MIGGGTGDEAAAGLVTSRPRAVMPQGEALEIMAGLTERYGRKLGGAIEDLAGCWTMEPPDLSNLIARAHQLSGTAPTFGFVEVGRLAGEIERLLSDRSLPWSEAQSGVTVAVDALRSLLPIGRAG